MSNDLYLKPCPHCGGKSEFVKWWKHDLTGIYVRCKKCEAMIGRKTAHGAQKAWNRRQTNLTVG